jgi:hypothetical protein
MSRINKKKMGNRGGFFCRISASGSNFNPRNTPGIPVVKIFAFLDLGQN